MKKYKYVGISLTPSIARDVILQLFERQQRWERQKLGSAVKQLHATGGGLPSKQLFSKVITKALLQLSHAGALMNITKGVWCSMTPGTDDTPSAPLPAPEPESPLRLIIEDEIGEGAEAVYVYYLPDIRRLAESAENPTWPCKVGFSATDAADRILNQQTGMHQYPVIGLLIHTDQGRLVEKLIHAWLAIKGTKIPDSPGDEWFVTSPTEVMEFFTELF